VRSIRVMTAALVAATVVGLSATAAWAHVTVQPPTAPGGGFVTIAFQVPNEEETAVTTKVEVQLPTDHPFASVSVMAKAGWTYTVEKAKLPAPVTDDDGKTITDAVSTITWQGGKIAPGEFDQFVISGGAVPDSGTLAFPTIQTYDDGTEVAWIEQPGADGKEPEHPTPKLTLTAADASSTPSAGDNGSDGKSTSGSAVAPVTTTLVAASPVPAASDTTSSSNGLAIVALIVGGLALIVGIAALAAGRSSKAGSNA
jgi:uncharacterized protein YcnI